MGSKYPQIREDIVVSKVGQEMMLFDPKTDQVHVLNETAAVIWEMTDGRHSKEEA